MNSTGYCTKKFRNNSKSMISCENVFNQLEVEQDAIVMKHLKERDSIKNKKVSLSGCSSARQNLRSRDSRRNTNSCANRAAANIIPTRPNPSCPQTVFPVETTYKNKIISTPMLTLSNKYQGTNVITPPRTKRSSFADNSTIKYRMQIQRMGALLG